MKAFSALLERLAFTPARNRKIAAIVEYLKATADPDRGYALAAITGDLKLKSVQPSMIRTLAGERIDPELFRLSHDFVGDLAETVALTWQGGEGEAALSLCEIVGMLQGVSRSDAPGLMRNLLDRHGMSERYAIIKLATGALRMGVSARLARQALADFGKVEVEEIEELWHGLKPPYGELFDWLEGRAEKPVSAATSPFRPVMLSHPLEERDEEEILPRAFLAEWKWDGIRIQLSRQGDVRRMYSRTGEDISAAFPDIMAAAFPQGTFDGELLVRSPMDEPLSIRTFSDLQQRLNRKSVPKALIASHPAFIRLYDLLLLDGEDLRALALGERRLRLENAMRAMDPARFDLSPAIGYRDFSDLVRLRREPPHPVIEGIMLKRLDSPYIAGRVKGHWFKWKRDPMTVDAVLMYAQRGHGKRSGYYSDFTFGVWRHGPEGSELVPVGKAYFGFTDDELKQLDRFVRENTLDRFGPVRSVRAGPDAGLVLEVAFEGIQRSSRHKSGIAMRFPRISRIRWDKPAREADRLETLENLIGDR